MPRLGFVKRLVLRHLLATAVGLAAVAPFAFFRYRTVEVKDLAERLRGEAQLVARQAGPPLASGDRELLDILARESSEAARARVTLIAPGGAVLGDSEGGKGFRENLRLRPEVIGALDHGEGVAVRPLAPGGADFLFVAVVLREGDPASPIGVVRLAIPLAPSEVEFVRIGVYVALAALAALAIGSGIAYLAERPTVHQLAALTEAAGAIAAGDFVRRPPLGGEGEVGIVARALKAQGEEIDRKLDALAREKREMTAIVTNLADGVIACDADLRAIAWNDAALRLLGAERPPEAHADIFELARDEAIAGAARRTIETGLRGAADMERTESGRTIRVTSSPIVGPGGRPEGVVLTLRDVTEERRYDAMRREFVANASHELKTPLASVRGYLETLLEGAIDDPQANRRFLERARSQTARLKEMVEDLLALARAEAPSEHLEKEPCDLAAIAADAVERAKDRALRLEVRLEGRFEGEARILGDRAALGRAFDDLIDNALKHTPPGGRVEVRCRREKERAVAEVADTGRGISPEDLPRIFERFYRVEKGRARAAGGGAGLGLAIVKHIVLAQGGEVRAASEPGAGATFTMTFPAA